MPRSCQLVAFVDDDDDLRHASAQTLELAGLEPLPLASAEEALRCIGEDFAGVVVTDIRMPVTDGLELFGRLREMDKDLPVILITGHGDVAMAVRALKDGAYDFLTKPYPAEDMIASVRRALEKRSLVLENRALRRQAEIAQGDGPMLGRTPEMQRLRETIRRLAQADVDVLIEGETGVGKELAASVLHRTGRRRGAPFVAVDCAALAEGGAESELFGHESGYGGALRRRSGRIESSNRGILFLDDVDALSFPMQARLLRVLDERAFTPSGSNEVRPVDLRVIASTKVDLAEAARRGTFREDLFHRLNLGRLRVPALRERRDDVALLYGHFLAESVRRFRCDPPPMTESVRRRLMDYDWPGNVRELAHFAERVALGVEETGEQGRAELAAGASLPQRVDAYEAELIREALNAVRGDVRSALIALGIPRKTFYDKLRRHSIDIGAYRTQAPTTRANPA